MQGLQFVLGVKGMCVNREADTLVFGFKNGVMPCTHTTFQLLFSKDTKVHGSYGFGCFWQNLARKCFVSRDLLKNLIKCETCGEPE
jgi:hypothetical protein